MPPRPQLEPFLRQATRGLWGEKRRLVRAELLGHLSLRTDELRLEGLSQEQAVKRALEELGPPAHISAGMRQVYVLPRVWPLLALSALTLSLLVAWPKPSHLVPAVPWEIETPGAARPTLVRLADVRADLRRQGAGVERIRIWSVGMVGIQFKEGELFARVVLQDAQEYLPLDDLVMSAVQQNIPFTLSGWENPALRVGKATLRMSGPADPYSAYAYLARWAVLGPGAAPSLFRARGPCVHELRVRDAPGTVYALLVPQTEPSRLEALDGIQPELEPRIADVAPAGSNGLLTLRSHDPSLEFGGGKALLVRLSGGAGAGKVEYRRVKPEKVQDLGCTR